MNNELIEASKVAIDNLVAAALHEQPWQFDREIGQKPQIQVFTCPDPASGINAVCGQAVVSANAGRVLAEVSNPLNWKSWDDLLDDYEVQDIDEQYAIVRLKFKGIWPVSARDVVYIQVKTKLDNGTWVVASRGIEHADFPESPDFVRADLYGGGWHITPSQDDVNSCTVTYYMHTNPKLAMIPNWVMNMAVTRFPAVIDKVRNSLHKIEAS
jgi:hypothetical protein